MEANHDQFMSWYNGYNYTAPPSILPENSPLQMNRSDCFIYSMYSWWLCMNIYTMQYIGMHA